MRLNSLIGRTSDCDDEDVMVTSMVMMMTMMWVLIVVPTGALQELMLSGDAMTVCIPRKMDEVMTTQDV